MIASFRRHLYGSFLSYFYSKFSAGCSPLTIKIRDGELITFNCNPNSLIVIFTVKFQDSNDAAISRVFMQEYKDGKKAGKNAPSVLVSLKDPPTELAGVKVPTGSDVGFITFVLTASHGNNTNMQKTVECIHNFFPHLKYHLSCAKAYLHCRMRSKTEELIKILNRARPESFDKKLAGSRSLLKQ
uniref:Arp2/3 complex 34 kDa subunit n=1 Tax=Henneguya salminicola TaxID=69463 RepID=A0A6G3MJ80_HENSL